MGIFAPIITDAGAALFTRAVGESKALVFTHAELGVGVTAGAPGALTELVTRVCDASLDEIRLEGDVIKAPVLFTNRAQSGFLPGFTVMEIGLFARLAGESADVLIAYATAGMGGEGILVPGDALTEFTYLFQLRFDGAADVVMSAEGIQYVTFDTLTRVKDELSARIEALEGKADRCVALAVTALSAAWTGDGPYEQVISVTGMAEQLNAVVGLSRAATAEQARVCRAARLRPIGQGAGSITLAADGPAPAIDLPLTVIILG